MNCAAASWFTPSLSQYLEQQTLSNGNRPDAKVCFTSKSGRGGTAVVGRPITVKLESPFTLVPIFGVGTITLSAQNTMRLEQNATNPGIASEPVCP